MGFFSDFNKKHLQLPEEEWNLIEDTPQKKVWQNEEFDTIEMNVRERNGIPIYRDGELLYNIIANYGNRSISSEGLTYNQAISKIDWYQHNFKGKMSRMRIKKKFVKPKPKRKPVKRCKCKVK
jgi:hypothetical protein